MGTNPQTQCGPHLTHTISEMEAAWTRHRSPGKRLACWAQFHFLGENIIITKTNKARYTRQPKVREAEEGWRLEHRSLRPEWIKSDFKNKRNLRQMTPNKSLKFPK